MPQTMMHLIVLKKTKLAEMDLIITAFSEEGYHVQAVIKGGRKPGSRRGAHLELFCRSQALLHQGRGTLMTVSEAELVNAHAGCRSDIEHSSAAAAVCELVEAVSRDADSEPRLFNLLDATLSTLDNTPISGLYLITAAALLKITAQIGFTPYLEGCLLCGAKRGSTHLHFSFEQGGLLCDECSTIDLDGLSEQPEQLRQPEQPGQPEQPTQPAPPGLSGQPAQLTDDVLGWVVTVLYSRYADLAKHTGSEYTAVGRLLLLFARNWMRTQVTPKNRSLDFMLALG